MQITRAKFFWIFIFGFCKPETNWKIRQSDHISLNYTQDALSRLCQQTDIGRIDGYLDQIAVPRPVGSENHKKVALFIRFTLENLGYSTEFVTFTASTVSGVKNFTNIVATKHPLAEKRLVLACHYDSKSFETFTFVGATDSALPCALMLDAAQTLNPLMPSKAKDDMTLQLVFFDGEEAFLAWDTSDSLYGSRYLAHLWSNQKFKNQRRNSHSRLSSELDRIDVLVLLDLLGARGLRINNFATNDAKVYELFPQIESQLSDVPGCLNPSVGRIFDDYLSYMRIQDDHIPFFNRNVKTVHLIPTSFPSVWHTAYDTRDALDRPTIDNLAAILRVFVARYLRL
uniref:Glutaminyl-peptide cyclotransferase n=1 Tax=Romanomermis culicivorax TaxID=13658 RepID=A0A915JLQ2_ROMCU